MFPGSRRVSTARTVGGTFTKLTADQAGSVLLAANHGYDSGWADYDNDGDPDVWVEDASGLSRLHENDGHGFFSLVTSDRFLPSGAGGAGMWGDYDNDGFLDLFVGGYAEAGTCVNAAHVAERQRAAVHDNSGLPNARHRQR